ncbi:MAG: hypothetical protein U0929_06975 [Planctomycetaceae bacterium]
MADVTSQSTGGTSGTVAPPEPKAPPTTPPKAPRKSGCGCMLPLLLLAATLGFAPQIISMTSLRNQVPGLVIAGLPPGVVIGSASAGWLSAIQLNDIVIPDDQGRPSLKLKNLTISKSIWELAQAPEDLGRIVVEQPELKLYTDNGETNYDQLLKRLSARRKSGKRSLIDLELNGGEITIQEETRPKVAAQNGLKARQVSESDTAPAAPSLDGVLAGTEQPATEVAPAEPPLEAPAPQLQPAPASKRPVEGQLLAIIDLQKAAFKSQSGGDEELIGELTAKLREPAVAEPVTGELRWNLPDGDASGIGSGKLKLIVPSLPLAVLSPWLASFTSGRDIGGNISIDAKAEVVPSDKDLLLAAQITLPRLDIVLSPADGQSQPFQWSGENLHLTTEGQGDLAGKEVKIGAAQLRTPFLNADFGGTLRDLDGPALCDLEGKCDLNPSVLLAALPPEWNERVRFEGLQLGQVRIVGALRGATAVTAPSAATEAAAPPSVESSAQPLRIQADVQWAAANILGFQSQNALINVDWSESALAINPNRMPLGQGHWVASPRIEFTPQGRYLVFDGGPLLENIDFTQEMSNTWLRYVSPILGSATSIEGKFSLSASPARVAMFAPYSGDFEGVIDIHSAQVGPGPLTQQILGGVASIQSMMGREPNAEFQVMTVEEQKVPFAYAEGRVYHKDLKVSFGEVVVQSQGSVGLDQTINFQLLVPIPDKWTEGKPVLAALKGEAIPFQMGGTLDQPQLDGRALGDFGKRIGIKSIPGLLQRIIEKQQEKKANGGTPARQRRNK